MPLSLWGLTENPETLEPFLSVPLLLITLIQEEANGSSHERKNVTSEEWVPQKFFAWGPGAGARGGSATQVQMLGGCC